MAFVRALKVRVLGVACAGIHDRSTKSQQGEQGGSRPGVLGARKG